MADFADGPVSIPFEASGPAGIPFIPGKPGFTVRVLGYALTAAAPVIAKMASDSSGTPVTGGLHLGASGIAYDSSREIGVGQTPKGEGLTMVISGAVVIGGHVTFQYVPIK